MHLLRNASQSVVVCYYSGSFAYFTVLAGLPLQSGYIHI